MQYPANRPCPRHPVTPEGLPPEDRLEKWRRPDSTQPFCGYQEDTPEENQGTEKNKVWGLPVEVNYPHHPLEQQALAADSHLSKAELRATCSSGAKPSGPTASQSGNQIKRHPIVCKALNYGKLQSNDNCLHVYMSDSVHLVLVDYLFIYLFIFDPGRKTGTVSSFPKKLTAYKWAVCPTWTTVPHPGVLFCPELLPQPPHCLCLSAALLIHSILAAASCVIETARNFLFGF